jgi:hypothetical protein
VAAPFQTDLGKNHTRPEQLPVMKTALRLSVLLNCCLVVLLVLLALDRRAPTSELPPAAASEARQEPSGESASLSGALLRPEAGAAPGPLETAVEAAAASRRSPRQDSPDAVVSMPLVFQDVDLSALALDSGQSQAIEDLRQRFVEEIGGLNQDPTDAAYRERWQQSQPENDGLLRGFIGVRAWQDYQLAARSHE